MAWAPDYVTAAEVRHALRITTAEDDPEIAFAISAASRAIDDYAGRQFGKLDAAAIRIYPATEAAAGDGKGLVVDDVASSAGVLVAADTADDGTFATTFTVDATSNGYRLWPWNATADGRPWTELRTVGGARFPLRPRAVRVTALWGWPAVPAAVRQAALTQVARLFKRKDAPFGVAGSPELGSELRLLARLDPDVELLLAGLRRRWLAA